MIAGKVLSAAILLSSTQAFAQDAESAVSSQMMTQPAAIALEIVGLSGETSERFMNSASVFTRNDGHQLIAYDLVTRCSAVFDIDEKRGTIAPGRLVKVASSTKLDTAPSVVATAYRELQAIASGQTSEFDCIATTNAAFGLAFSQNVMLHGAIARHGISVLQGATVEGAGATAEPTAQRATSYARNRIKHKVIDPVYLGAIVSNDRTLVVIGDPGSTVRWVVQYRNLSPTTWKFEGALDADFSSLN